jgi:hypothetical protein
LDAEIWGFLPLKGGWEGDGLTPMLTIRLFLSLNPVGYLEGGEEIGIRD